MVDRGPGAASLDAGQFRALASYLQRMADDLDRRAASRRDVISGAGRVGHAVPDAWRSPVAATMAEGFLCFVSSATAVADGAAAATGEIRGLAEEAARLAQVVAEVEQYEKSWNQQFVANWSEWQDRVTTAAAGLLPGGDDERSRQLNRLYQEQTRHTEEASARRRQALARWHTQCGAAAMSLRVATGQLDGFAAGAPPPELLHPDEVTVGKLSGGELDTILGSLPEAERGRLAQVVGRLRAEETKRALRAAGIDPDRFRPEDLHRLDPSSEAHHHLIDVFEENARRLGDPAYSTGYYGSLGVEGTRAVIGALEMMQFNPHHALADRGELAPPQGDRVERIIAAHAQGFAVATRSPELADDLRGLLDTHNPWQLHQLAILASGPPADYDPRFLGDAAFRILVTRADDNAVGSSAMASAEPYPPLYSMQPLYSDDRLNLNEAIALHALAGSSAAAWAFAWDGTAARPDALATIIRFRNSDGDLSGADRLVERGGAPPAGRWDALVEAMRRDSLTAIDNVLANAETAGAAEHGDAARVYSAAMTVVGEGGASGPAKQRVADHFGRYLSDMDDVIADQEQTPGVRRGMFDRPDLVRYFAETLDDPEAAAKLGFHLTTFTLGALQGLVEPVDSVAYADALGRFRAVERLGGALLDGAAVSKARAEDSLAAAAMGSHVAVDFSVEAGLLLLPGAASAPAEIVKTWGHGTVDQQTADAAPTGDPAGALLHDMTNRIENRFAEQVRGLSTLDPDRPASLGTNSEELVDWWFRSRSNANPIQAMRSNTITERDWYDAHDHWDKRPEHR
jgi:hypothetical protein